MHLEPIHFGVKLWSIHLSENIRDGGRKKIFTIHKEFSCLLQESEFSQKKKG